MKDEEITEVSCKLYYNVMMIASENPLSNKNIKLYLCSYDNEGVNIIWLKIGKLFESSLYWFFKRS